jgi:L-alanine-DL-glutamate epimerase-like enolase superfamily enzyme
MRNLSVAHQLFPIRGSFRISRGAKTEAGVVVASIEDAGQTGRGEAVPYARYGETITEVICAIEEMKVSIADGMTRLELLEAMQPGAARNALDCALWDIESKQSGVPAWRLAGLGEPPRPVTTAFTLSLDDATKMESAAKAAAHYPLLKVKLGADGVADRLAAIRRGAPSTRLIVDANEGWTAADLPRNAAICHEFGVELIEQPLHADFDEALRGMILPVALGADESCHIADDIPRLKGLYQIVNIKLDKSGGLTAALALMRAAEEAGLGIMVGCMVATSLAMAPAMLLAQNARYVDLDGPLLLDRDRDPGLRYDGALVHPPDPVLWG